MPEKPGKTMTERINALKSMQKIRLLKTNQGRQQLKKEYATKIWNIYGKARQKATDWKILPGNLDMALQYAAQAHKGAKRRSGLPYLTHPTAVLGLIIDHGITDKTVYVAAILHDVIEERVMQFEKQAKARRRTITPTDKVEIMAHEYENIRKIFGKRVADLVLEVSKDPETGRFRLKTREGMIIKMADRIHNLTYFESIKRQKEYVDKTSQLIHDYRNPFKEAHPKLYQTLRRQHKTRAREVELMDLAGQGKDYDEPEEQ